MVDWKKVLGTSVLSASLVFSSFAPVLGNAPKASAKSIKVKQGGVESTFSPLSQHVSGQFDVGIANREKLLASLNQQGIIDENAPQAQQEKQLNAYLETRAKKALELSANKQDQKAVRGEIQKVAGLELAEAGAPKQPKEKPAKSQTNKVGSIIEESWDGPVQTDEVLVLLIDFPDYSHSSITEEDGPVLMYDDYSKEHYEDMVFGDESYVGGNGEQFISMKEYYEQQSGGSYTIDGAVSEWYTAEHPAAYYGENDPAAGDNDMRPRELIKEALVHASQDPSIDLSKFDVEDIMDLDGDGNYREPDGIIDHLMVVHAGTGEEAGGGAVVGADAIWSHSSSLEEAPFIIPNTEGKAAIGYWGGNLSAYAYTVQPEDGATGVFAHEFGHDLGLPDEYDTAYTADSVGAPTEYWTLMSAGSWAGLINGTEPTGFSPYDKEYLQNKWPGSNWFKDVEYSLEDIISGEKELVLDQASVKGTNADAVRISLPNKDTVVNVPTSGQYEYHSGSGNLLDNSLTTSVDLTGATSGEFKFNAFYDIEEEWDYASVQVKDASGKWTAIQGTITTDANPYGQNPGHGITGSSDGWENASFDLSAYAGQVVEVRINYWSDPYVAMPGLYVDDIEVVVDGNVVAADDAESDESVFTFDGFTKTDGKKSTEHYYLVEWRNWAAADTALGRTKRGDSVLTHDRGMVIWYVDNLYSDNWVGDHPGDGFLGVVDAHQKVATWSDDGSVVWGTRYQIQDAAFSLNPTDDMFLDYSAYYGPGVGMALESQPGVPTFNDGYDYTTPDLPYSGRNVVGYGLDISVVEQADDMTTGKIKLSYEKRLPTAEGYTGLKDVYSGQEGYNKIDLTVTANDGNFGEEVTVKTEVVNGKGESVLTDEQSVVSTRENQDVNAVLTVPADLPSGEYTLNVEVTDGDNVVGLAPSTFEVDNDAPTPVVDNNGSEEAVSTPSVTVNVPDAVEGTLEYMWSKTPEVTTAKAKGMKRAASDVDTWKPFTSGDTLTLEGVSGEFYLHVRGNDAVGNQIVWTSNPFSVDGVAPVLTLAGENPFVLPVDSNYVEPGFSATDDVEGDITGQVVVTGQVDINTLGEYILTYTVTDMAGNVSTQTRRVHVVDTESPYIELTGGSSIAAEAGSDFVDPGYTVTDNRDKNLTAVVTGSVNTSIPGVYTLTYSVTDNSGNSYTVTRTVTVADTIAPKLVLAGEGAVVLEAAAVDYVEPGFTASDSFDKDVTVEVAGSVDVNKVGDYVLTYTATDDSGNKTVVTRTVSVVDTTAPVIKLSGDNPFVLEHGQAYVEPGFVVTDTLDGNITDYVVVSSNLRFAVGEYTVTYTVKDAAGNETKAARTVKVVDKIAPELVLKGANPLSVIQGTKYEEPGFKATDNADGDLTDKVTISGIVDTKTVGSYKLIYTVVDASGNKTSVERVVTVNKATSDNNSGTGTATTTGNGNGTTGSNTGTTGSNGGNLPDTATNSFNILFAGVIVLVIGAAFVVLQRRRKGLAE